VFVSSGNGNESAVMRRGRLPSPRVNESVNLWSILRSNIGKDLSKVAMPVQLNEPMNTLQRLCEEVEYCHLLDTAANTRNPHMRMVRSIKLYSFTHSHVLLNWYDFFSSMEHERRLLSFRRAA